MLRCIISTAANFQVVCHGSKGDYTLTVAVTLVISFTSSVEVEDFRDQTALKFLMLKHGKMAWKSHGKKLFLT